VGARYPGSPPSNPGQEWMIGFNITPVVPNVVAEWFSGK
jgi:hypothetical protein